MDNGRPVVNYEYFPAHNNMLPRMHATNNFGNTAQMNIKSGLWEDQVQPHTWSKLRQQVVALI